jgi:magnesium transporter
MPLNKRFRRSVKIGLPPGTIVHIGEQKTTQPSIDWISFSDKTLEQKQQVPADELRQLTPADTFTWINLAGLHDIDMIRDIGEIFSIHPLVLEDITNTEQRPKIEYLKDQVFIILKHLTFDTEAMAIKTEQICVLLGKKYVLSFQEYKIGIFEPLRKRLEAASDRFYNYGMDYLFFAVMDIVVDNYDLALESIEMAMETLEDEVLADPQKDHLDKIHSLKKEVMNARRIILPMRELVRDVAFEDSPLLQDHNSAYFRDLHDHIVQLAEMIETLRETISGLMDTYLTHISNRMNEVMKVLTIVATIFIPLSFLAGVYGMNFEIIPELKWPFGYGLFWGLALSIGIGLLVFFRRRRWL